MSYEHKTRNELETELIRYQYIAADKSNPSHTIEDAKKRVRLIKEILGNR
jgi:hypothetical protein